MPFFLSCIAQHEFSAYFNDFGLDLLLEYHRLIMFSLYTGHLDITSQSAFTNMSPLLSFSPLGRGGEGGEEVGGDGEAGRWDKSGPTRLDRLHDATTAELRQWTG